MYSTAKKLSVFCFILAIVNIVFTLCSILMMVSQQLSFTEMFIKVCYLGSGTLVPILLTVATRSICSDLEIEYDARSKQIRDHEETVKKLEAKIKNLENNA